jgi:hypothetical protein
VSDQPRKTHHLGSAVFFSTFWFQLFALVGCRASSETNPTLPADRRGDRVRFVGGAKKPESDRFLHRAPGLYERVRSTFCHQLWTRPGSRPVASKYRSSNKLRGQGLPRVDSFHRFSFIAHRTLDHKTGRRVDLRHAGATGLPVLGRDGPDRRMGRSGSSVCLDAECQKLDHPPLDVAAPVRPKVHQYHV